jgi:hypothetical protein
MVNEMTVGANVKAIINGTTRTGTIIKVQKNGRIVMQAEAVYQERTGRRLYSAQRFTVEPQHLTTIS